MKKLLVLGAAFVLTIIVSGAFAGDKAWGADEYVSVNDFPSVTSGPGAIMPDSRLYFLDKLSQEFKLAMALSPDVRSKVHVQILGERMAELRVMQARNNKEAMITALTEVQRESLLASKDIRDASAQGKDVAQLAHDTHQVLNDYRLSLVAVAARYPDSIYEGQLLSAADTLKDARTTIETAFSDSDQEHELAANSLDELNEAVLGTATWAQRVENKFRSYEKYASGSGMTTKQREQKISEIKKKISELQKQLKDLSATPSGTPAPSLTPKSTK